MIAGVISSNVRECSKMNIEISSKNGIILCTIEGGIVHKTIQPLDREITACLESSPKAIILNFEQVSYLDSTGVGLLMRCHAQMLNAGGRCIIAGAINSVAQVLKTMRLDKVLIMADSVEQAKEMLE